MATKLIPLAVTTREVIRDLIKSQKTFAAGYMNEPMQPLTWQDIRYTTKGKVLYAFCLGIPQSEIKMTALASEGNKIASVELLGGTEKISWKVAQDGLVIEPSSKWPCEHAVCYKITLN